MAEINVRFDLQFSSRAVRLAMIGAMVLAAAPELASESVSLTTYYPAPSGVYTQLITTSNTFLARDGGYLDVGTSAGLAAGNKMAVMGGNVGIGTTAPAATLQVTGSGGGNINFIVNGRMQTGDGSNSGGIWLDSADNIFVGQNGTDFGVYTAGAGWTQTIDQSGNANFTGPVGTRGYSASSGYPGGWYGGLHTYDVYSEGSVGNGSGGSLLTYMSQGVSYAAYKVVTPEAVESQASCGEVTFAPNSVGCTGTYITTMSGVYARYMTLPLPTSGTSSMGTENSEETTINALCCSCPSGGGCDL